MDQRTDLHRRLAHPAPKDPEDASVSTFVAAALVLPLLAMVAGAGVGLAALAGEAANVNVARDAGVVAAEVQGGVTAQVVSTVETTIQSLGIDPTTVQVSGTAAPVPWGSPIALTVTHPVSLQGFPWTLIGLGGQTVTLGGTTYATSNLAP